MIRVLIPCCVCYLACVLEVSGAGASSSGIEPRWLLLAAAHFAWTLSPGAAVLMGGVCGVCGAAAGQGELALGAAVMSAAAWLLCIVRRNRRWTSLAAYLLCVFVFTAACSAALPALGTLLADSTGTVDSLGSMTAAAAIRTAAQGAVTALWGGAVWCLGRGAACIGRFLSPPLEWRS
jgi:hypothetical protein